jgi:Mu-like prophage I protein
MTSIAIATNEVSVAILEAGDVPDWIMVIPAGEFSGRDGRGPYKVDPEEVIEATAALDFSAGLPIDYDHATDFAAPNGGRAPAAGWMTDFQVRDGAIWAHVEWTAKGREAVSSKEYRYISPVFSFDDKTGEVLNLLRAGLTNSPNLYDTAICSRPTADSLAIEERTTMAFEIEKHNERRRKIEAITFPPRITPTFSGVDPFRAINAAIAKRAAHVSRGKFLPDDPSDRATTSLPSEGPPPTAQDHYERAMDHLTKAKAKKQIDKLDNDDEPDHLSLARECLTRAIECRGNLGMHSRAHRVRFA